MIKDVKQMTDEELHAPLGRYAVMGSLHELEATRTDREARHKAQLGCLAVDIDKPFYDVRFNNMQPIDALPRGNFGSDEAYFDYILLNFSYMPDEQLKLLAGMSQGYIDMWKERRKVMQSATQTAMENVAMRDMEQALEAQNERNRQRAIAIVNYWMYEGDNAQVMVAHYVKQLEDKIKALQGDTE